jgi:hypothetical protein
MFHFDYQRKLPSGERELEQQIRILFIGCRLLNSSDGD